MKVFIDSASHEEISSFSGISGVTTNPTICRKANVGNYEEWARDLLGRFRDYAISIEVLSDDHNEMLAQAEKIASWGENAWVKIPVTNSKGEFSGRVIRRLSKSGVKVNVTAILTTKQVKDVIKALDKSSRAILSIFAGRIADTGVNPRPTLRFAVKHTRPFRGFDVLWASPRQVLDISHALENGVDIITASPDILKKLALQGKDLTEYSRETVEQFLRDAQYAGYSI